MIAKMTTTYLVWGYAVAAVLYISYTAWLFNTKRKLERGDDVGTR